jgi:hypothetical protein
MARSNELIFALNAGAVDKEALSRIDLEKMRLAGEQPVTNYLPKVTGPMTIRPGLEMLSDIPSDDQTHQLRFARSTDAKYVLLMSDSEMRISLDGSILQIPDHSTTIASGSWTDESSGSATATGGATLTLQATATASARLRQSVSVSGVDDEVVHILRVVVSAGPVYLRVGSTAGGQELLEDQTLDTGTHKIAFTPGDSVGTIYIDVRADDDVDRTVSQIDFEANLTSGDLVLPHPWTYAQLQKLRTWQSIDVLFCGDGAQQQRKIERRGDYSWSVALYEPVNGPYITPAGNITMTSDALTGNATITASENYFTAGHEGTQIELEHTGKTVTQTLDGADQATDYITVTGIDAERIFYRTATRNALIGTLTLQRSVEPENPTVWSDYATYVDGAADFSKTSVDDNEDNLTAHYRFSIKTGDYTSGDVEVTLEYENTIAIGNALITGYTSPTEVDVEIRDAFGAVSATSNWRIGAWSDALGWPRVPIIHDDRLHWFDSSGRDYGSEVDDYVDFDDTLEGDAAPFTRSVAGGMLEGVVWAQSDSRLLVGTPGYEATIQASEFDGALTPTDYTSRKPSRRGCADLESVPHHSGIFYVQRSGKRIYEIAISPNEQTYRSQNISRLNPSVAAAGIVRMACQLMPETRLYMVLSDGTCAVLTFEKDDEVIAFTTISVPSGTIEDVCVLPDTDQDEVYFIVKKGTDRYHMRLGAEEAQESVATCTLLDYWQEETGSVSAISGATHLASTTVQVWADGQRRADVTLDASGNGNLDGTYSRVVYGRNYDGEFTSVKLAYAAVLGTAIGQEKTVRHIGLVMSNSCLDGTYVGFDEANAEPIPDMIDGVLRTTNQFFDHIDISPFPVGSTFDVDSRVYVKTESQEGPATVQAIVIDVETPEGYSPPRNKG